MVGDGRELGEGREVDEGGKCGGREIVDLRTGS
jgi:hypothetical protein